MSTEIIKIDYDHSNRPTVLGRTLHEALGVETPYSKWFPRMCEYGFSEEKDYHTLDGQKCPTNNPKNPWTVVTDHQLTISMAKEIAMLQRTQKGKEIRQYFIEVEEKWNDPNVVIARALIMSQNKIEQLEATAAKNAPKVAYAESVEASPDSFQIGEFSKVLRQNGIDIGRNRLFSLFREHGYLIKQGELKNIPTQKSLDLGVMEVQYRLITVNGEKQEASTPRITGKGKIYFLERVKKWLAEDNAKYVQEVFCND